MVVLVLRFADYPMFERAQGLSEPGVADAPVANGFCEEAFYGRGFLGSAVRKLERSREGLTVVAEVLQPTASGAEVCATLQADVADERARRCEAQSASSVDCDFPTDIPRDRIAVDGVKAGKIAPILHSVDVVVAETIEGFLGRSVVHKVLLPAIAPGAPAPTAHVGREIGFVVRF